MIENEITLGITNWKESCRICHKKVGFMNINQDFFFLKNTGFFTKTQEKKTEFYHICQFGSFFSLYFTPSCTEQCTDNKNSKTPQKNSPKLSKRINISWPNCLSTARYKSLKMSSQILVLSTKRKIS